MPEICSNPECLLLVRSTLEMAALMKLVYPEFESAVREIEAEVRGYGQLLLEAGSIPRARVALEAIHGARLKLQQLDLSPTRFTA